MGAYPGGADQPVCFNHACQCDAAQAFVDVVDVTGFTWAALQAGAKLSDTTERAEGEPQALGGGAVLFGGTMKRAVVKRRRMQSGHTTHGAQASGGFLPLALFAYLCTSPAPRCLRFWFGASGVTGGKKGCYNCPILIKRHASVGIFVGINAKMILQA